MRTFRVYTLGCKANQYDSQVIREQLGRCGLVEPPHGKPADCYIINTCTVTSSADSQSRNLIRKSRRENPSARLIVTGCYAHSNADDIKKIGGVDLVINNTNKFSLPAYLKLENSNTSKSLEISAFQGRTRAFVKIQDGCNNFCSFCKVPFVRGRSRSRQLASILSEAEQLSHNGYQEIVLTGICLGDYGKDLYPAIDVVDAINAIEKIPKVSRIRLSSINAGDISNRLIDKLATSQKLCPHLHISFQSGDNDILRAMKRADNSQKYVDLVQKLKKEINNIAITVDILIGFPGEDEEKFNNTIDFLRKIGPARTHIFTFSPRELTPLSAAKRTVPDKALKQRFKVVKKLTDDLSLAFKQQFLSCTLSVLFEEEKDGFWQGYSQNYLLVRVKKVRRQLFNNTIHTVRIAAVTPDKIDGIIEK